MTQSTSDEHFYTTKRGLFKKRFCAFVIDSLLVYGVILIIEWIILLTPLQFRNDYYGSIFFESIVLILTLSPIYQISMYVIFGQSVGKRSCSLNLQGLTTQTLSIYKIFLREFIKNIFYLGFFPFAIIFEVIYFKRNGFTIIDKIFKTNVLEKNQAFKFSKLFFSINVIFLILSLTFSYWFIEIFPATNAQTLGIATQVNIIPIDPYSGWPTYTNLSLHYHVRYPKDWAPVDSGGIAKLTSVYIVPIAEVEIIKQTTEPNKLIYGLIIDQGLDDSYFSLKSSDTLKVQKQVLTLGMKEATILTLTYSDPYDPDHKIGDQSRRIKFNNGSFTFWIEGQQYFDISNSIIASMIF